MLLVLSLVAIEKLVNLAIASDPITQINLQTLSGKTLQIALRQPKLSFNVLFNEQHIRFEPVFTETIFEPKFDEKNLNIEPTAMIVAQNVADLLAQLQQNSLSKNNNLQDENQNEFLSQIQQLIANFDPDIIGKLQLIVGLPLASQLTGFVELLKSKNQPIYRETNYQEQRLQAMQAEIDELKRQIQVQNPQS